MVRPALIASLALVSLPALAQQPAVMQDWSSAEMKAEFAELQIERVAEGKLTQGPDKGSPAVAGQIAGAVVRAVGRDCTEKAGVARCGSADFMCDIRFKNPADADKAMGLLAFDAVAAVRVDPATIRLHRNVLLSGGVTRDNLRGNALLFITTLFDAQNKLRDAKLAD